MRNENENTGNEVVLRNEEGLTNQNSSENQANVDANNLEFGAEIRRMLQTAGTLELTEMQNKILYAPVKDSDVYIKPDGLIYLSWIKYSGRLTNAFTGTGWAMIPQGMPKMMSNLIVWGFHLVIKGVYCGFAIGEQQYFDNGRMSYGEACEGAKSNALMRLCKNLGIGLELWDKAFIDRWVAAYGQKKWDDEKRKYLWSLKPNAFGTPNPVSTQTIERTENSQQVQKPVQPQTPVKTYNEAPKKAINENNQFLNQKEEETKKAPRKNAKKSETTNE